jgi:hypothetical protein
VHLLISIVLVLGFCIVIVVGLLSALHDLLVRGFFQPPERCIEAPDSHKARGENCEQSMLREL